MELLVQGGGVQVTREDLFALESADPTAPPPAPFARLGFVTVAELRACDEVYQAALAIPPSVPEEDVVVARTVDQLAASLEAEGRRAYAERGEAGLREFEADLAARAAAVRGAARRDARARRRRRRRR